MPVSAAIMTIAATICSLRCPHLFKTAMKPFSSGSSTSRRKTRIGLTFRTSSNGGRQNSSVVKSPVARPASADFHGKASTACTGSRLPNTAGRAIITPTPAATPRMAPAKPSPMVCRRKMRSRSPEPAPIAFKMASTSMALLKVSMHRHAHCRWRRGPWPPGKSN